MKMFATKTHKTPFFSCHNSHNFLAYPTRMRILYLALLILIFNTPVAFGAGCADATNQTSCDALAGCEFINNTCTPCQNGEYKEANSDLCEPCPNGYDYSQITNGVGATKRELCYKFCPERTENGTIYRPGALTAFYPNNCSYTIFCVTSDDLCNSYALDLPSDNTCYPVWTEGTNCTQGNKSTGIEIYHATDGITINYCTSKTKCNPGYHFEENNKYYCSIAKLGQCVSDQKLCADIDKLTNNCGGTISGEATWNGDTYDLSKCTCTTTKETEFGLLQTTCSHSATSNQWTNCKKEMIHCNAGYWAGDNPNPDDCVAVGYGYYSENADRNRKNCPAGSTTSTTTAASINNCHMTAGKTKICDTENNCITLPGNNSKFFYKGKTQ